MARKRQLVPRRKVRKLTAKKRTAKAHSRKTGKTTGITGRPSFHQEMVAIFGIFLSLFIYLSLFAHIFRPEENWSGKFGSNIAKGLFDFIGWGAYVFPTLILAASILFFRSQLSLLRLPHVVAGLSGAIIGFCGMLSAFALRDPSMIVAGGFVGKSLFTALDAVVGHGGAMLIFFFIFLISLMIALQFSPYVLITNIGTGLRKIREFFAYLLSKFNDWREALAAEIPEIEWEEEEYEEEYEEFDDEKAEERRRSFFERLFGWTKLFAFEKVIEEEELDDDDIFPSIAPTTPIFTGKRGRRKREEELCESSKAVQPQEEENRIIQKKATVAELPQEEQNRVQDDRPVLKAQAKAVKEVEEDSEFAAVPLARGDWKLPPISLLNKPADDNEEVDKEVYYRVSQLLEEKLLNFGVKGKVIGISPGPVVTTYEYAPAPGVKINKIVGLADDLKLGLKVRSVRVAGAVPGKAALGIEIPNKKRQIVPIRRLIGSEEYRSLSAKLSMVLGLDVAGSLSTGNLAKMPHLLIAGATGAGKSVGINTIIASILYNATPEEVRFLMVDPKRIELSGYEGIPHLLHPVVVEPKLASRALNWAVREMERRYRLLEEARVKSFDSYNEQAEEKLPYIVIIADELADLMMVASKDVEAAIARLAQMARAAGMHVILATQRPSVDVLTGLIKANFPTRISFKVSSKIDSRTILDTGGAEHLLGMGDMLYLPNGGAIQRVHGAYISEKETADIVDFWKEQGSSTYDSAMVEELEKEEPTSGEGGGEEYDEFYDQAVAFVTEQGQASISSVQRRLRVGYNRAANMIEQMERDGIVGPANGAKPREVIVRQGYEDM